MDIFCCPVNVEEQHKKIIEDTFDIICSIKETVNMNNKKIVIKNFGAIDRQNEKKDEENMYNLGRKLVNYKDEKNRPDENLGNGQVFI